MADPIVDELVQIKRLLIRALLKNGLSQDDIAAALGKDQSAVSRMFGKGGVTKRARGPGQKEAVLESAVPESEEVADAGQ